MVPRVHDLNGKVLGFLWNTKPNGDILLMSIKEHLSQRFHLAGTKWYQKEAVAVPAPENIISGLVDNSDLVINAVCD